MRNRFWRSLLSSTLSILPIVVIIFALSLSNIAPIGNNFIHDDIGFENYIFLGVGAVIMIFGLTLFQTGAAKGLSKVGEYMGSSLSKQSSLFIIILFSFALGALITCAEPSILIVAHQVNINKWVLIGSIAGGVGIFVVIGVLRIIFQKSLNVWYLLFYLITFMLISLLSVNPENHAFLPFIFDAGGVTTGSGTVPFILAIGAGVATVRGGKNARDSSFGLVGMASIGPIIAMTILIMLNNNGFADYQMAEAATGSLWERLLQTLLPNSDFTSLGSIIEVLLALAPIVIIFFVYELIFIRLPGKKIGQLLMGFLFSFVGLVLFLTAVGTCMSPIGMEVGKQLGSQADWICILVAFALGLVTILCEPAVHVLTGQIEAISDGQLRKRSVLFALSIGVGLAIGLAMIRTIYKFSIMYYIIPGYIISLVLMFFVPNIYTAIAFDSGGTASGPMAVSFILPLIIGVYAVRENLDSGISFYSDAFGVVALIALTPILAVQFMGVATQIKQSYALYLMRTQIADERNSEIIHFN